jgi:CHAT domain-containing protein
MTRLILLLFIVLIPNLFTCTVHAESPQPSHPLTRFSSQLTEEPRACGFDRSLVSQQSRAELQELNNIDELLQRIAIYQNQGQYDLSELALQRAASLCTTRGTLEQEALIHSHLGDVLLAKQKLVDAADELSKGLKLAYDLKNPLLIAHLLNNLGNLYSVQQLYDKALDTYLSAFEQAQKSKDDNLQTQILTNQVRTYLKTKDKINATALLHRAVTITHKYPEGTYKAFELLGLGQLSLQIAEKFNDPSYLETAYQMISESSQFAEKQQNKRLRAYATGYLGQVYEQSARYPEALQLTREAIFRSQGELDLLYRWEWQRGRILLAQNELAPAEVAYRQALEYLQPIRSGLTVGQRNAAEVFHERIRPVYFGLADVLLRRATQSQDAKSKALFLEQAINTVEKLKVVELQDYFQDECVTAKDSKITEINRLDKLAADTAVLYPILLADRIELLLTTSKGVYQASVPVKWEEINDTVLEFQKNLQVKTHRKYINQANALYNWLIAPVRAELDKFHINTIIFVPDGPLRMIPMAALHDGQHYLIEDFAVAVTPSIELTNTRPLPRQNISVLLNGLSQSVQGFSALPNVPQELSNINALFSHSVILLNEQFSVERIDKALQSAPYVIVHIASHGQFDHDPKNTFLLTYNDKLTMDRLERLLSFNQFRENTVELLTLSACQTAVGDERAALGLAGVAIKAGARSALASLWFVNDTATAELIGEFYNQLRSSQLSKAQALQNAQKKLLEQKVFNHPIFWAPFLLIGNWL